MFDPAALGGGRRLVGLERLLIGTDLPGDAPPVQGVGISLGCLEGFSEECEGGVGIPFCDLQQPLRWVCTGSTCPCRVDARSSWTRASEVRPVRYSA